MSRSLQRSQDRHRGATTAVLFAAVCVMSCAYHPLHLDADEDPATDGDSPGGDASGGDTPTDGDTDVPPAGQVGTYVDSGDSQCLSVYLGGAEYDQGTPEAPWCTLDHGIIVAVAIGADTVRVSRAKQTLPGNFIAPVVSPRLLIEGGYDSANWGVQPLPGVRTPLEVTSDTGVRHAEKSHVVWKGFDLYRATQCSAGCRLVEIVDATVVLEDVRVGGTSASGLTAVRAVDPLAGSATTFTGVYVASSGVDTTATLRNGTVVEAAQAGGQRDTYGVELDGTGGTTSLVVQKSTLRAGAASVTEGVAAALRTRQASSVTISDASLCEADSSALRVFGFLDGIADGYVEPALPCGTLAPCQGSSMVSVAASTISAVSTTTSESVVGVALFGTSQATFSGASPGFYAEGGKSSRTIALWTFEAGSAGGVQLDQVTVSARASPNSLAALVHGYRDGWFDAISSLSGGGSQGVELVGGSYVAALVGDGSVTVASVAAIALHDTKVATLQASEAGDRVHAWTYRSSTTSGSPKLVAGLWTTKTSDVAVSDLSVELVTEADPTRRPIQASTLSAAWLDGWLSASGVPNSGSTRLSMTASSFLPVVRGYSGSAETACVMLVDSRQVGLTDSELRCDAGQSAVLNTGWMSQLWLRSTQEALIERNVLASRKHDTGADWRVGILDGDPLAPANPYASTGLTLQRNRIELASDSEVASTFITRAVGVWLARTAPLAAVLANNVILLKNFGRATGLHLAHPTAAVDLGADGVIAHNTIRLGAATSMSQSTGAAVLIANGAPPTSGKLTFVNNLFETGAHDESAFFAEAGAVSESAIASIVDCLLVYAPSPTNYYARVSYTTSGGMLTTAPYARGAATSPLLGRDTDNPALTGTSPFCATAWNAYQLDASGSTGANPAIDSGTITATGVIDDIDGDARNWGSGPDMGADEVPFPPVCFCDGEACP